MNVCGSRQYPTASSGQKSRAACSSLRGEAALKVRRWDVKLRDFVELQKNTAEVPNSLFMKVRNFSYPCFPKLNFSSASCWQEEVSLSALPDSLRTKGSALSSFYAHRKSLRISFQYHSEHLFGVRLEGSALRFKNHQTPHFYMIHLNLL